MDYIANSPTPAQTLIHLGMSLKSLSYSNGKNNLKNLNMCIYKRIINAKCYHLNEKLVLFFKRPYKNHTFKP